MSATTPCKFVLAHKGIDYKKYKPNNDEQAYLLSLISNSDGVQSDFALLGEYKSIKDYAELMLAENQHLDICYYDNFYQNSFANTSESDQVYRKLRGIYMEAAFYLHYMIQECLPIYKKSNNKYSEITKTDTLAEQYRNIFYGHSSDDFSHNDTPILDLLPHLEKIFYSEAEQRAWKIFFSQYVSGNKELKIRERSFRLYLDGKLFNANTDNIETNTGTTVLDTRTEEGLLLTIAILAIKLDEKSGNSFRIGDKINARAMADAILEGLPNIRGMGDSSVRKRIGDALKLIKEHLPE
jgi:hypothetical protein